jgi:hypothetical protein
MKQLTLESRHMDVILRLSKTKDQELKDLMKQTGIRSHAELVNHALTSFQWMVQEIDDGRFIASVDEAKGKPPHLRNLVSVPLSYVAQNAASKAYTLSPNPTNRSTSLLQEINYLDPDNPGNDASKGKGR